MTARPTLTEAQQEHRCFDCGAEDATPYPGARVPYCDRCKATHRKRRKRKRDSGDD